MQRRVRGGIAKFALGSSRRRRSSSRRRRSRRLTRHRGAKGGLLNMVYRRMMKVVLRKMVLVMLNKVEQKASRNMKEEKIAKLARRKARRLRKIIPGFLVNCVGEQRVERMIRDHSRKRARKVVDRRIKIAVKRLTNRIVDEGVRGDMTGLALRASRKLMRTM